MNMQRAFYVEEVVSISDRECFVQGRVSPQEGISVSDMLYMENANENAPDKYIAYRVSRIDSYGREFENLPYMWSGQLKLEAESSIVVPEEESILLKLLPEPSEQ
jgi:hypothetical protein